MSSASNRNRPTGQRAFSLLQLILLLAIAATLALVATHSTSRSWNEPRSMSTDQTLSDIRSAIAALPPTPPSKPVPKSSSFVADMGRLPRARQGTDTSGNSVLTLGELLTQGTLRTFSYVAANNTNSVLYWDPTSTVGGTTAKNRGNTTNSILVPCGWRGPYIYTAVNQAALFDGWGKPLEARLGAANSPILFYQHGTAGVPSPGFSIGLTNRCEIAGLGVSPGSGAGATQAATDDTALTQRSMLISSNDFTADLTIRVKVVPSGTGCGHLGAVTGMYLDVRIFGPNPNSDVSTNVPIQCVIKRVAYAPDANDIVTVQTSPLRVGPKVVIVEVVNTSGNTPTGTTYVTYPSMVNLVAGAKNVTSPWMEVD